MSLLHQQDFQDAIFTQIVGAFDAGDFLQVERLTTELGDYTSKINMYSSVLRNKAKTKYNPHHINDEIGALCAKLFRHGLFHASYLIYCLASHEQYVDGFTMGFVRHFIHNQWCHSIDGHNRILQPEERDIELLRKLIMGIGRSQIVKVSEGINHIIHHLSRDQFNVILHQLKQIPGFSLRNSRDDILIDLAIRPDDGLLELVVDDILNGDHGHGTEEYTIEGTEEMTNTEVGFSFILHIIPQALRKLRILYDDSLTQGNTQKAAEIYTVAQKIVHFTLQLCKHDITMEHDYITELWNDLESIHTWDEILSPIRIRKRDLDNEALKEYDDEYNLTYEDDNDEEDKEEDHSLMVSDDEDSKYPEDEMYY